MQIAMVGLGRMGGGMSRRLLLGGHDVVVFDVSEQAVAGVVEEGARGAGSLAALVEQLQAPRVVWVMLPSGDITQGAIDELAGLLQPGDVLVDGGNARWTHSTARAAALAERGIHFLDVGTSGGVWGLEEGYCLMAGGDDGAIALVQPAFETLAPDLGWAHVGPVGSGHYTKMVHNGVEYGMMQAYAEGFELLTEGPYDVDPAQVAEVWRHGSVVRSWLLDLAARAFEEDPGLRQIRGWVEDSGEGRWTLEAAIDHAIPTPVISAALFARFSSRRTDTFGNRVLAALRNQFGGHAVRAIEREDHV